MNCVMKRFTYDSQEVPQEAMFNDCGFVLKLKTVRKLKNKVARVSSRKSLAFLHLFTSDNTLRLPSDAALDVEKVFLTTK